MLSSPSHSKNNDYLNGTWKSRCTVCVSACTFRAQRGQNQCGVGKCPTSPALLNLHYSPELQPRRLAHACLQDSRADARVLSSDAQSTRPFPTETLHKATLTACCSASLSERKPLWSEDRLQRASPSVKGVTFCPGTSQSRGDILYVLCPTKVPLSPCDCGAL